MMDLELRVRTSPDFQLEVRATVHTAALAVLGRSGAGKTTLLEALAGVRPGVEGRLSVNGRELFDSKKRLHLPPEKRRIGYVPQDALLFPHLTARQNLRFGAKVGSRGDELISLLELEPLLDRYPSTLSGGERQRVSLARALATEPLLLLLDEPLAAVDVLLKERILPYLARVRDELKVPLVYVTHQLGEARVLAGEVLFLERGEVKALGPIAEVLASGALDAYAQAEGAENVFLGMTAADATGRATRLLVSDALTLTVPESAGGAGRAAAYAVSADDVLLASTRLPGLSARNVLPARVLSVSRKDPGSDALVRLEAGGVSWLANVTPAAVEALGLQPGAEVFLAVKSHSLRRLR